MTCGAGKDIVGSTTRDVVVVAKNFGPHLVYSFGTKCTFGYFG